ncbi:hypothetical protein OO006_13360 [Prosthecochloris sp. SCSIO W1101]|uniref:hypothetical protein n=1 Tax=Prosthecochloris sp. SCSIO W1101 TaxID=2992242 RepID=UPI00223DDF4E|nr:hypothetical protein [Prosthecochloris sp. SCSIO W1101]UZJ41311.1 hypothetical protein OO006_13360 [Prosthecochloris sp. SCSIO W1101]
MNAKKLFDDFSGIDKLGRCRNGFEVSLEWREKIGDGLMSMIKHRAGPLQSEKNMQSAESYRKSDVFYQQGAHQGA